MEHFMKIFYAYTSLVPTDIYPVQYGEEQCKSKHGFGPGVRSNYLIHYVFGGKGKFRNENGEWDIGAGEMFLISPNELTYYEADKKDPWHYAWIEFNGSLVRFLLKNSEFAASPVCADKGGVGRIMQKIVVCKENDFMSLAACLWELIAAISNGEEEVRTQGHEYVKKAESYIKINIHKKINVTDVAAYIGIDRSHLSRLFKQHLEISPQQYILSLKMKTAANYLKNTNITINEAAQSVGYFDVRVFGKAFRKYFGISPSVWRKKNKAHS